MTPLLLFVHGFMGSSESFKELPKEIQTFIQAQVSHFEYETKGEYNQSMIKLSEYLNSQNQDIIILAHSMGGPLSIDATIHSNTRRVKGILTFDSPFFGLHPSLTQAGANRGMQIVNKVSEYIPKTNSGWGLLALGIAGAVAAIQHPEVSKSVSSLVESHTKEWGERFAFLGPLWDVPNQNTRFQFLDAPDSFKFHGFYLKVAIGLTLVGRCNHIHNSTAYTSPKTFHSTSNASC